jgi:integrase/recombinase XerD
MTKRSVKDDLTYGFASILRDIAVLELLFATGVRVSELCYLQPRNINLRTGLIKVNGKGNRERVIQIFNPEVRECLSAYYLRFKPTILKGNFFFVNRLGNGLSDQSVRNLIRKYVLTTKISKNITPHSFRHTFATLLLEADVDITYIQHFLGHSSIMTTQIYAHVNKRKLQKILATKHPRSGFKLTIPDKIE